MDKIAANPLVAGLIATLLLAIPLKLPILTPLQMALPLPVLLVAVRQGNQAGLMALGIPILGAFVITQGWALPLIVGLLFGAFPLLMARLLRKGWAASQVMAVGFILGALVLGLGLVAAALFMGGTIPAMVVEQLAPVRDGFIDSVKQSPNVDAAAIAAFTANLDRMLELLALLFPSLLATSWFVIQCGNLLMVRTHLLRKESYPGAEEDLTELRLPFVLVWPMLLAGLMAWLGGGNLEFVGWNLAVFLSLPFSFQGLAIAQKAFERYKIGGFLRGMFYAALIMWVEAALLLTMIGFFDVWFDFRNRYLAPSGEEDSE